MKQKIYLIGHSEKDITAVSKLFAKKFDVEKTIILEGTSKSINSLQVDLEEKPENIKAVAVFGNDTGINYNNYFENCSFEVPKSDKDSRKVVNKLLKIAEAYGVLKVGFGQGAILLALNRNCSLLFNQCVPEERLLTFLVGELNEKVEFLVKSDHSLLMYPINIPTYSYEIKAFSSFYSEVLYFDNNRQEVNVGNDFVEPEIINFGSSVCFNYLEPTDDNPVICDLTLQNINL